MTAPGRFRLAVDFGTSTTIAMLQWPDGRVRPLLFDGSPLLPSAILLGSDGRLHTGRDAAHLARGNPERLETNPKRRIDDGTVLLGDAEVPVLDLIATVLRRVAVEAAHVGGPVADVTLTHPAGWGGRRRALLAEAAERAGLARPNLVSEPVAAAAYFARMGAGNWPGAAIVVYDLGAGTCDITVLRRQPYGFEVVVSGGLNDVGGLDVDAAIVAFLEASHGPLWTDAVSRRQVWDEVRTAKEMLSRASGTVVALPALGTQVPLGREQLEGLARPVLRPTTALAKQLLLDAGIGGDRIAGLYLVGGASRTPLCATLLHEALGVAPVVTEQPELVVAEGGLYAAPGQVPASDPNTPVTGLPVSALPALGPQMPVSVPPVPGPVSAPSFPMPSFPVPPVQVPPRAGPPPAPRRRTGLLVIAAALAVAVLLGGGAVVGYKWLNRDTGATGATGRDASPAAQALKYPTDRIPERPCDKVDIGPLADLYEVEASTPTQQKNLSTAVSVFTCAHVRQHVQGGLPAVSVVASFYAYIYADTGLAANQHKTNLENGKLNGIGSPAPVDGIGQDAFVYRSRGVSDAPNIADFVLDVRDGNLVWELRVIATRVSGNWSDPDLNRLRERVIASGKSSYGRLSAG